MRVRIFSFIVKFKTRLSQFICVYLINVYNDKSFRSHYEVAKKIADYLGLIEIQEDQEEDKYQGSGEEGEYEGDGGSFTGSSRCNEDEEYEDEEYADDQSESDYGDNDYDDGSSSQNSLEMDNAFDDQSEGEIKSFPV